MMMLNETQSQSSEDGIHADGVQSTSFSGFLEENGEQNLEPLEFVQVLPNDNCDIAWKSCGIFQRSVLKIKGKFTAKCTLCHNAFSGRVYRLVRHVEKDCPSVTAETRDIYMSEIIETGKNYVSSFDCLLCGYFDIDLYHNQGQRGGKIVLETRKRLFGEDSLPPEHVETVMKPRKKKLARSSHTGTIAAMELPKIKGASSSNQASLRSSHNFFDLSYPINDQTIFWPGGEGFKLCMNCSTNHTFGYDYAAGTFTCAEHGGTHVDAPFHFAKDGATVDQLPMRDLIGPCKVIDIKHKFDPNAAYGGDFMLTADDILQFEALHGALHEHDLVVIRTGWHRFYAFGAKSYLGFDEGVDGVYSSETSRLCFPGIAEDAARWLVARNVAAVGLDTGTSFRP